MKSTDVPLFEEHAFAALDGLRASLTELYQAAGADPDKPQVISREFGLNRNLTWKVSRIVRAESSREILQHLPGVAGLHIFLDAFLKRQAPTSHVEAVRLAIAEFERMLALHAGDRPTLELLLDGLSPEETTSEALETSRRLAFQGNSGIWGVQAETRLRTSFLAPNPLDPGQLDCAQLVAVLGLRRLRHGVAWPLLERKGVDEDGFVQEQREEPLIASTNGTESFLVPEFCSDPQPEVQVRPTKHGSVYEQVNGRLGNSGRVNCVYGSRRPKFMGRAPHGADTRGQFFSSIDAPVEHMIFDLIVHKDLVDAGIEVEGGVLQRETTAAGRAGPRLSLPGPERVFSLGNGVPRVATPLVPRYGDLLQSVCDQLCWNPADFRGWRFELSYPPLPCTAVLSYSIKGAR